MKIGITCYPVAGGSGVIATELGLELAKRGHQVHFIAYSLPFRLQKFQENLFFHEVEVSHYPLFKYPPYTLNVAAKMAEVSQKWDLDILHVHYAIPHATCAFLAKSILGKDAPKIVTTLHGTDITLVGSEKGFYQITKFSIEASDGVTAVSQYLREVTKKEFGIANNIECLYNFVDTGRFDPKKPLCEKEKFAAKGEKILLHMSNFRPLKRVEDVIQIFALVRKEIPCKLLLIGDGPKLSDALVLVNQLKLESDTIFLGQQEWVENLLCLADLFLLPSDTESFGLAALEALSSGVPVIGTNLGGLPEVVENEKSGYLLPLGDVEGMAKKALELLENPDKLKQFKENARERAVRLFDSQLIIPKYEQFYQKVLNSPD